MTAYARRIEHKFTCEMSWGAHPLIRAIHALSSADETNYLLDECAGYRRSGMPANDTDKGSDTVLIVEDEELLRVTLGHPARLPL
jgi:hypothetical protein